MVERMQQRMLMHQQMMGGLALPGRDDLAALLDYLGRHGMTPFDPATYPDLDNIPEGRAFRDTCARCHALPDPRHHTAAEWTAVLARMQRNMAVMQQPAPDAAARARIEVFLSRHARTPG